MLAMAMTLTETQYAYYAPSRNRPCFANFLIRAAFVVQIRDSGVIRTGTAVGVRPDCAAAGPPTHPHPAPAPAPAPAPQGCRLFSARSLGIPLCAPLSLKFRFEIAGRAGRWT
jgi:hypothetical protein